MYLSQRHHIYEGTGSFQNIKLRNLIKEIGKKSKRSGRDKERAGRQAIIDYVNHNYRANEYKFPLKSTQIKNLYNSEHYIKVSFYYEQIVQAIKDLSEKYDLGYSDKKIEDIVFLEIADRLQGTCNTESIKDIKKFDWNNKVCLRIVKVGYKDHECQYIKHQ